MKFVIFILEGSWSPADKDKKPYIQFKLNRKEPLYGITMQGNPLYDQYVTSYNVMYGDDGNVFDYVKSKETKSPKVMHLVKHFHYINIIQIHYLN